MSDNYVSAKKEFSDWTSLRRVLPTSTSGHYFQLAASTLTYSNMQVVAQERLIQVLKPAYLYS